MSNNNLIYGVLNHVILLSVLLYYPTILADIKKSSPIINALEDTYHPVASLCQIPLPDKALYYRPPHKTQSKRLFGADVTATRYVVMLEEPNFAGIVESYHFKDDISKTLTPDQIIEKIYPTKDWTTLIPDATTIGELVSNIIWTTPLMTIAKGAVFNGTYALPNYQVKYYLTERCVVFFDVATPQSVEEIEAYFRNLQMHFSKNTTLPILDIRKRSKIYASKEIAKKTLGFLFILILAVFVGIFIIAKRRARASRYQS